mgnify:CR=1 FL=1
METPKNLLNADQKKLLDSQKQLASKSSGTGKLIVVFLIGAVVGAFGFWLSEGDSKKGSTEKVGDEVEMTSTSTEVEGQASPVLKNETSATLTAPSTRKEAVEVSGNNAIAADAQKAGTTATINMITLSVPGWVAIHEDRNGSLGNILGAARFEPGIHLGVVELLRPTIAGSKYHAVLYQDNGDRGFNTAEDAPIKDGSGKVIETVFEAN